MFLVGGGGAAGHSTGQQVKAGQCEHTAGQSTATTHCPIVLLSLLGDGGGGGLLVLVVGQAAGQANQVNACAQHGEAQAQRTAPQSFFASWVAVVVGGWGAWGGGGGAGSKTGKSEQGRSRRTARGSTGTTHCSIVLLCVLGSVLSGWVGGWVGGVCEFRGEGGMAWESKSEQAEASTQTGPACVTQPHHTTCHLSADGHPHPADPDTACTPPPLCSKELLCSSGWPRVFCSLSCSLVSYAVSENKHEPPTVCAPAPPSINLAHQVGQGQVACSLLEVDSWCCASANQTILFPCVALPALPIPYKYTPQTN
jgi:hypothetical protein